jgi:hypothetical protein
MMICAGAPASDFNRMVWIARLGGVFFLSDDYIDSGKEFNRIPGFKRAAEGHGVSGVYLFPNDYLFFFPDISKSDQPQR